MGWVYSRRDIGRRQYRMSTMAVGANRGLDDTTSDSLAVNTLTIFIRNLGMTRATCVRNGRAKLDGVGGDYLVGSTVTDRTIRSHTVTAHCGLAVDTSGIVVGNAAMAGCTGRLGNSCRVRIFLMARVAGWTSETAVRMSFGLGRHLSMTAEAQLAFRRLLSTAGRRLRFQFGYECTEQQ